MPAATTEPIAPPAERWVFAEVRTDGTGEYRHAGETVELPRSADLDTARQQMMRALRALAVATQAPVWVTISDPDGEFYRSVPPEGNPTTVPEGPSRPPRVALRPVPPPPIEEPVRPAVSPPPSPRLSPAPVAPAAPPPVSAGPVRPAVSPAPSPPVPLRPAPTPLAPTEQPAVAAETGQPPRPDFDALLARRPDPGDLPATQGVRGALRILTRDRWRPAPSVEERAHRDRVNRIQADFGGGCKTIAVVNPKGGAHKTTAAFLLSQKLGSIRGGGTCFVDWNESRSTAAWRAQPNPKHHRTVDDLIHRLTDLDGDPVQSITDLDLYVRRQGLANFDLIAGAEPDNPFQQRVISAHHVRTVNANLRRFYRVLIEDTGNAMGAPNWGAAVLDADQLVIVSTVREDTGQAAGKLADALVRVEREDLLHNAVTVLSAPGSSPAARALHGRFQDHFGQLTRAVHTAPFDPVLDNGTSIYYPGLLDQTHEVWEAVAADVADGLAVDEEEPAGEPADRG